MTGQVTLPNVGLTNGWTPGSDGWNGGMDANLAELDALLFLQVASASTVGPPGSPTAGMRYICPVGSSGAWSGHDTCVAVYNNSAWTFYTPQAGWRAYVADVAADYLFDGTAWNKFPLPYDMQIFRYSLPSSSSEPIMSLVAVRALTLPVSLTLSRATLMVAGTGAVSFPIKKNGTSVGSINFASASLSGTFTFTSAVTLSPGDIFEVYAPSPQDLTAAGLRAVIVAYR